MPVVRFPYGQTSLSLDIPGERFAGALVPGIHRYRPDKSPEALVRDAMRYPVGSPRLSELARGKRRVVLIASDHTRPVPSRVIVPRMLEELREGNPGVDITLLIATGCHRGTTRDELIDKFGRDIVESEKIVVHDCDDAENLVSLGRLPSGAELVVNRLAAEADLLVAEGFIEPHFFAGFSGGRKSVLPGIASRSTVLFNHNSRFIADPRARTGILDGNPIHADMLHAARAARLAYIVNVVVDADKRVVCAVAGDADAAHRAGCAFLTGQCRVTPIPSDIVITSNGGFPLDQNIYQSVKGMTAAESTVREGGVIIMAARCDDGHGGRVFHQTFRDEKDLARMTRRFLETPPEATIVDQWQSQIFARVLTRATVVFVSNADDETVSDLHMIPAHSLEQALDIADRVLERRGVRNGSVLAIPDGVSVIV